MPQCASLCRPLGRTALWTLAVDEAQPLDNLSHTWYCLPFCRPVYGEHLAEAVGDVDCCRWVVFLVRSTCRAMYPSVLIDQQRERQVPLLLNCGCFSPCTLHDGQHLRLLLLKPGIVCCDLHQNLGIRAASASSCEYEYQVGTSSIIGETDFLPAGRGQSEVTNQLSLSWACLGCIGSSTTDFGLCHSFCLHSPVLPTQLFALGRDTRPELRITCAHNGPCSALRSASICLASPPKQRLLTPGRQERRLHSRYTPPDRCTVALRQQNQLHSSVGGCNQLD